MKKIFSDKRFKYGTYSTVITLVILAILVAVNLVAGEFDYKIDLSENSVFSLSDETRQILDQTDEEINIYTLFSTKDSDAVVGRVEQVLDQYRLADRKINIENKDLYLYPDFAGSYTTDETTVSQNSIIVESGEKYKVISYSDYYDDSGNLSIEENITSAIQYVTNEANPVIYFITGHGEMDHTQFSGISQELRLNNYSAESLNLLESDIPEDCTMLFITPCTKDYSAEEAQKVKDYLTNDGRAIIFITSLTEDRFPNLCSVMADYGVEPVSGYVMESNESNYIMYPVAVMPTAQQHEITNNIISNGYNLLAYMSQALKETDLQRQGLVIEPLITTSDTSFVKSGGGQSMNKEVGDESGPFDLAYAITDSSYTDTKHTTKVVVSGCFYMLLSDYDSLVNGSGATFVMDSVKWLDEGSSSISIRSKSLTGETLVIDDGDKTKIQVVSWAVIPGVLFLAGFGVWLKRRNG